MHKHPLTVKILSMVLALMILASTFALTAIPASAKGENAESHQIAVVFDNSGSMYDNESWCRAKYAMEIFASMLDYETDSLSIFPMWEVTTDGSKPAMGGGSYRRIDIKGVDGINQINKLFTVNPSGTPYSTVTEAYDYLKNSNNNSKKWLIVLTDGEFLWETRDNHNEVKINLQDRLPKLASDNIQVQYLGFGSAAKLKEVSGNKNFHVKNATANSLKDDLVEICNNIFQRAALPESEMSGNKITLDLSMSKLIVFVQGKGAKIESLTNSKGKKVEPVLNSGQRTYSTITANDAYNQKYSQAPVDDTLAGQVITFGDCPTGEYTLNYSGTENIQIFYEPNVKIKYTLINSKTGEPADLDKREIDAGEYKMEFTLVDGKTDKDILNDESMADARKLLGKVGMTANIEYKNDEGKNVNNIKSGDTINLQPGDDVFFKIEGSYLEKFNISTESNIDGNSFDIREPDLPKLKLDAESQQDLDWYQLKDHDNWKPVKVSVTIDGEPLTDEQMANLEFTATADEGLSIAYKMIPGESAYEIYVGQDEEGNYVEPARGDYKITVNGKTVDEYGREMTAEDSETVLIRRIPVILVKIGWLLAILIILALTAFILTRKAWPKTMYFIEDEYSYPIKLSGGSKCTINLVSDEYSGVLNCTVKKNSRLYQRNSRSASILIVDIAPDYDVKSVDLDSDIYVKQGDTFKNSSGEAFEGATRVGHGFEVKVNMKNNVIKGTIGMNTRNID